MSWPCVKYERLNVRVGRPHCLSLMSLKPSQHLWPQINNMFSIKFGLFNVLINCTSLVKFNSCFVAHFHFVAWLMFTVENVPDISSCYECTCSHKIPFFCCGIFPMPWRTGQSQHFLLITGSVWREIPLKHFTTRTWLRSFKIYIYYIYLYREREIIILYQPPQSGLHRILLFGIACLSG